MLYLPVTMQTVYHALWLPDDIAAGGALALWAESSQRARADSPGRHPFAVGADQLTYWLWQWWRGSPANGGGWEKLALPIILPSDERQPIARAPAASATRAGPARPPRRAPVLRAWRVEAIAIPASQALAFLLQYPRESILSVAAPSLSFWRRAGQWVAGALAAGEYLPSADARGRGRWRLAPIDSGRERQLAELAEAMPPSARALARPLPAPRPLLDDFLAAAAHGFLSQAYTPSQSPFFDPRVYWSERVRPKPADVWWSDLFSRARRSFEPDDQPSGQTEFGSRVRAWAEPISAYLASPWRVAIRLEPPSAAEPANGAEAAWRLSFHLQPKDKDGSDGLWAAAEIWESPPHPDMPDRLTVGLAQAARVCPHLEPALDEAQPEALLLTTAEAVDFLEKHAGPLSEQGFGVLVPAWWRGPARRLSTRLSLAQPAQGSGLLGMDALVDFNWQLAIGDQAVTAEELTQLAKSKTSLVQVRGEWMQLDPQQVQAALKLVRRHQQSGGALTMREALGLALAGPSEWEGLEIEAVQMDARLDELARRLSRGRTPDRVPQPAGFQGQLRPYQLDGLAWLRFLREHGFGACLADDMGLGKTIQLLALLAHDLDADRYTQPVLLICPTTVVHNWERETARFAPQLKCYAHHGPRRLKGAAFARAAAEHHLVVTSYALLARDLAFIEPVAWGGVALDEAHNIKNPSTKQAQAARRLRAGFRVALTGTPVENRLQDLWSIFNFLNPGYLGSAESFQRRFAGPIERAQDPAPAQRLRALTGPFILRRLKSDTTIIRDLPPKNEMKEYCGLTKEQAALYRAVVQESLRQIAGADGVRRRGIILATLTRLKQVCNHPRHLLGDRSSLSHRSGKLNRLSEMLEQALAEDDRVLIFTQYAAMGALLREHLDQEFGETLYLHGGTPAAARARMISQFQDHGPRLFVLSLKAGGAGINLTRANRVFHYDRWWNPAVENQATDRAYRIGQTQPVQVHKLICRGTLEERVDELIGRKQALAEEIIGSGDSWLTELSTDELRDLLLLRREALDD